MAPPPVTPVPLLNYPDASVSDYRFALNSEGDQIIFERSVNKSPAVLFYAALNSPIQPSLFPPNSHYNSATRPDWSWSNGQIAFCIDGGIVITDADGSNVSFLSSTKGMIYPAWYPNVPALAVMNNNPAPNPHTSVISGSGELDIPVVAGTTVWAGMPSVNPQNPQQFAFAGQYIGSQIKYNQDTNYIWFVDRGQDPVVIRPLDKNANVTGPFEAAYQGRAPWWSPDGNWIAFESNRDAPANSGHYAIYVQDSGGVNSAMQVTDYKYNGNHPKWFANGTGLVATLLQAPPAPQRGLYSLDVSAFVG
ncbi:hypothetical protein [Methylocella tundrae]|uniref:TolB family protein n=1 Tax=Methylocella tundrae TaxID=227605 RepID=UPI0030FE3ACB|nr:hypothetical protein SIN04_17065 [Methylocella tundrae]